MTVLAPTTTGPRERLIVHGGERAPTDELLAVLLGTGTAGQSALDVARALLTSTGGLPPMSRASPWELCGVLGVGVAQAARIVAAFSLGRRVLEEADEPGAPVTGPQDVFARLRPRFAGLEQELFLALPLDTRGAVLDEIEIARGSLAEVMVHPRELFRPLIRRGAFAAVVAHNHPSGDPSPSPEDLELTLRLRHVGEVVGIPIVDHIIVSQRGFVSIAERLAP